jgi:hypothetical protein
MVKLRPNLEHQQPLLMYHHIAWLLSILLAQGVLGPEP